MDIDPLAPLLAPIASLHGVGPATAEKLKRLTGGERLRDLLFHLPDSFIDRRTRASLKDTVPGQVVTWTIEIAGHEPGARPNHPWRVRVTDGTGFAELAIWEKQRLANLIRTAPGVRLVVCGRVDEFGGRLTMKDPAYALPPGDAQGIPAVDPVWPMTAKLSQRELRNAMRGAIAAVPELPEWHDPALLRREGWPRFHEALLALQNPREPPGAPPRARLGYDEMLAHQLAMAWMKAREKHRPGRVLTGDGRLRDEALARFGFAPTPSQVEALAEIDADLAAPRRMLRLLQGDVGSGKTLVALLAMLRAVEAGTQAALMAPTEVLAKQHLRTLERLAPCPVTLLTGSVKGAERRNILLGLSNGRIPIVVGTHALFQDAVAFRDLGLAVIDEQHRFGVEQRLLLGGKGARTDLLVMTATPIPRTLLLTQWGEMEVSRLTGKPAGRQAIRTTLHSLGTLEDVIAGIGRALDRGEQVYWVCPMVAESMLLDVAAAEDRFADLRGRFGTRIGLAHGQQDTGVRDAAIASFAGGGDAATGRHHGDRGRRRRPRGQRDGDRARRPLRPGAVAPAAWPGRTRRRAKLLPAAPRGLAERDGTPPHDSAARHGGRVHHRRRGFPPARRRRPAGQAAIGAPRVPAQRPGGTGGDATDGKSGRRRAAGARPRAGQPPRVGGTAAAAAIRSPGSAGDAGRRMTDGQLVRETSKNSMAMTGMISRIVIWISAALPQP